jgi:hypothetical protein
MDLRCKYIHARLTTSTKQHLTYNMFLNTKHCQQTLGIVANAYVLCYHIPMSTPKDTRIPFPVTSPQEILGRADPEMSGALPNEISLGNLRPTVPEDGTAQHDQAPDISTEATPQLTMSRRRFLTALSATSLGSMLARSGYTKILDHLQSDSNEPSETTGPIATSTVRAEVLETYSPTLREKARSYSDQEIVDFAKRTDWFLATPPKEYIATTTDEQGRTLPDPSTLETGTYSRRNAYRSAFTELMGQRGVAVTYDFDPYTGQQLADTDPDLDDKTLGSNLLGLATAVSRYPSAFLANLSAMYITEDRPVVTDSAGNQSTTNNYLSVINIEGPYQGSLVASIRGLWPEGAFYDMAHEGTHVLQTNEFSNPLFESVIANEPPLDKMLEWLNHNRESLGESQANLIAELLENCNQKAMYEEEAGAMTATLRRGFVAIPEGVDENGRTYLSYLLDKQVATVEMATAKTGVDMYAFVALTQRFPDIHPSEIEAALAAEKATAEAEAATTPEHLDSESIDKLIQAYDTVFYELLHAESKGELNPLFRIFDANSVSQIKTIYLDDNLARDGQWIKSDTLDTETEDGPWTSFRLELRQIAPYSDDLNFRQKYPDLEDGVPVYYTTSIYLTPAGGFYQTFDSYKVEEGEGAVFANQLVNVTSDATLEAQVAGYLIAIAKLRTMAEAQGIKPESIDKILEPLQRTSWQVA